MEVKENYDLKLHNTFGISVKCKYFVTADQEEELLDFIRQYEWNPQEILILGGGSNFLFTEDFDGTVFFPAMRGIELVKEDEEYVYVRVGAGEEWDDWVAWCVEHGYGGLENLSGIPGHVGAAPVQNVGAYGMEAGEAIHEVEAIQLEQAVTVKLQAVECQFAYRDSVFKHAYKNQYLITRVLFRLSKKPDFRLDYGAIRSELEKYGEEISLKTIRQAILRIRQEKLPDVKTLPSAGSFFKNPVVSPEKAEQLLRQHPKLPIYQTEDGRCKLAAGWLIEQCGWKGKNLGNAGVYEKQALVLVNRGGADGTEIARLANAVKKDVFMRFAIWLEPEVYIM
jgi:UDP-N-acetylmuramate dehydrogenase